MDNPEQSNDPTEDKSSSNGDQVNSSMTDGNLTIEIPTGKIEGGGSDDDEADLDDIEVSDDDLRPGSPLQKFAAEAQRLRLAAIEKREFAAAYAQMLAEEDSKTRNNEEDTESKLEQMEKEAEEAEEKAVRAKKTFRKRKRKLRGRKRDIPTTLSRGKTTSIRQQRLKQIEATLKQLRGLEKKLHDIEQSANNKASAKAKPSSKSKANRRSPLSSRVGLESASSPSRSHRGRSKIPVRKSSGRNSRIPIRNNRREKKSPNGTKTNGHHRKTNQVISLSSSPSLSARGRPVIDVVITSPSHQQEPQEVQDEEAVTRQVEEFQKLEKQLEKQLLKEVALPEEEGENTPAKVNPQDGEQSQAIEGQASQDQKVSKSDAKHNHKNVSSKQSVTEEKTKVSKPKIQDSSSDDGSSSGSSGSDSDSSSGSDSDSSSSGSGSSDSDSDNDSKKTKKKQKQKKTNRKPVKILSPKEAREKILKRASKFAKDTLQDQIARRLVQQQERKKKEERDRGIREGVEDEDFRGDIYDGYNVSAHQSPQISKIPTTNPFTQASTSLLSPSSSPISAHEPRPPKSPFKEGKERSKHIIAGEVSPNERGQGIEGEIMSSDIKGDDVTSTEGLLSQSSPSRQLTLPENVGQESLASLDQNIEHQRDPEAIRAIKGIFHINSINTEGKLQNDEFDDFVPVTLQNGMIIQRKDLEGLAYTKAALRAKKAAQQQHLHAVPSTGDTVKNQASADEVSSLTARMAPAVIPGPYVFDRQFAGKLRQEADMIEQARLKVEKQRKEFAAAENRRRELARNQAKRRLLSRQQLENRCAQSKVTRGKHLHNTAVNGPRQPKQVRKETRTLASTAPSYSMEGKPMNEAEAYKKRENELRLQEVREKAEQQAIDYVKARENPFKNEDEEQQGKRMAALVGVYERALFIAEEEKIKREKGLQVEFDKVEQQILDHTTKYHGIRTLFHSLSYSRPLGGASSTYIPSAENLGVRLTKSQREHYTRSTTDVPDYLDSGELANLNGTSAANIYAASRQGLPMTLNLPTLSSTLPSTSPTDGPQTKVSSAAMHLAATPAQPTSVLVSGLSPQQVQDSHKLKEAEEEAATLWAARQCRQRLRKEEARHRQELLKNITTGQVQTTPYKDPSGSMDEKYDHNQATPASTNILQSTSVQITNSIKDASHDAPKDELDEEALAVFHARRRRGRRRY